MRTLLFVIVALFVLSSAVHGQSRVMYKDNSLSVAPSVRAAGMGEASVTLVDPYSMWANPAGLALLGDTERLWLTGWPGMVDLFPNPSESPIIPRLNHASIAVPLTTSRKDGRMQSRLAFGYYHTLISTKDLPLCSYDGCADATLRHTFRFHNFVWAAGFSGRIEIGVGGTVRYIRQTILRESVSQVGFDVGLLIRAPLDRLFHRNQPYIGRRWSFTPALGLALKNFGPALHFMDGDMHQPRALHAGISTEILLGDRQRAILTVVPALELRREVWELTEYRLGIESGVFEAVYVRVGWLPFRDRDDQKTFGFSLHSRGIACLIWPDASAASGLKRLMQDTIDIQFSFATYADDDVYYHPGADRLGLSLTLR